jgi:TPR repeat protein
MQCIASASFYQLGWGVAQDDAKAREWYEKAADKGHADAMHSLGEVYEWGRLGVAQDDAMAAEWYEKAADKGDPVAKSSLEQLRNRHKVLR